MTKLSVRLVVDANMHVIRHSAVTTMKLTVLRRPRINKHANSCGSEWNMTARRQLQVRWCHCKGFIHVIFYCTNIITVNMACEINVYKNYISLKCQSKLLSEDFYFLNTIFYDGFNIV